MTEVWSTTIIAAATLIGWLATQAQARSRAIRREIKYRRDTELLKDRYIHRLQDALAKNDLPYPEHPDGWDEMERKDF